MQRLQNKDVSLLISTSFYELKAFSAQRPCIIQAKMVLDELKIKHDFHGIEGDAYVGRAKDTLVDKFLKSDHTHLMIIDSDHTWTVEAFGRMIRAMLYGVEVVAAVYRIKNRWHDYFCNPVERIENGMSHLVGIEDGDMRLLEAELVPGGFIIYSREAFERTRPNLDSYYQHDDGELFLECFKTGPEFSAEDQLKPRGGRIGGFTGEDVYFQRRYREMGGKIYVEPNVDIGHIGYNNWHGNYQEYLLEQRNPKQQEKSERIVEDKPQPLVSVVIPCYNMAEYLGEAIESVLHQVYQNVEIIVIDDGSTDHSVHVANNFFTVKIWDQENRGLSAARNAGIAKAKGDYIICLDADDKLDPSYIESCLKLPVDIVGTGFQFFGDVDGTMMFSPIITYEMLKSRNELHCGAMFKRKIWEDIGGFDETMKEGFEDWDFWLRAMQAGYKACSIQKPLYYYRKHGQSMICEANRNIGRIYQHIIAKHQAVAHG